MKRASALIKVPKEALFISEPPAVHFGNPPNEKGSAAWTNLNWLKSRFHFAFAEWPGPPVNFGVLRVLNDDLVQPRRGFGTHPHSNMEIATFVLQGQLTHQDSLGSKESLSRGSVQFMSAGSGIRHSEQNEADLPLRFLQLWILPDRGGLKPKYGGYNGQTSEAVEARKNRFHHVVSSASLPSVATPIKLSQDVNIFQAEIDEPSRLEFALGDNRQAYFVCAEGTASLQAPDGSGEPPIELHQGDACRLFGPLQPLVLSTSTKSFWLMVEMAKSA